MKRYIFLLLIASFGITSAGYGQGRPTTPPKPDPRKRQTVPDKLTGGGPNDSVQNRPSVGVIAKAIGNRIYLRWVPTMQSYWEFGYRDGYVLERVNLKTKQRVVLSSRIMPHPASEWQPFVDKNDRNYSILYTAIYEKPDYTNSALEQMAERRQLFHLAVFCADMNFQAARMAGLGFVDSTAVPGERYQYEVGHTSAARYKLKSALSTEVGLGDSNVLPEIGHFDGKVGGRIVNLFAETKAIKQSYVQYQVERSEDSVHFTPITDLPVVVSNKLDTLTVADTLDNPDITYRYRIRGLTLFQETGPYSKLVSAKATNTLPVPEFYTVYETDSKDSLLVTWFYKDSLSQFVDHFTLLGSLEQEGPFLPIIESIPADLRFANIKALTPKEGFTFFLKLQTTYRKNGRVVETLPFPVVLADDDPPVQPQGLKGTIEVKGDRAIVSLSWDPNPDSDLYGYFLNRRDKPTGNYHRVNNEFTPQTTLTDTIYLRQMQRNVYYTVKAIDFLFKQSIDSKALVLRVPDINPPTSPIIDSFSVADKQIQLHWIRSHSDDIEKHILYRKKLPATDWETLMTITDTLTQAYVDTSVAEKSVYAYTLIAFDDSQNQSEPATPVVLETPYFTRTVDFTRFTSTVDTTQHRIRLSWDCNQADKIDNFLIYRSLSGVVSPADSLAAGNVPTDSLSAGNASASTVSAGTLDLVKKADGNEREWLDSIDVSANKPYRYVIRARMQEGYLSGWKETIIELKP